MKVIEEIFENIYALNFWLAKTNILNTVDVINVQYDGGIQKYRVFYTQDKR